MTTIDEKVSEDGSAPPGKSCRMCRESLHEGARKCTECGSFQGWRSIFGVASGSLSMMVALVAVLTAAIPVFDKQFGPKTSKLAFAGVDVRGDGVAVFVTNSGDRPGLVTGATLTFSNVRREAGGSIAFRVAGKGGAAAVDPDKSALVEFEAHTIKMHGVPEGQSLDSARACSLTYVGREFSGVEIFTRADVGCAEAFALLRRAEKTLTTYREP